MWIREGEAFVWVDRHNGGMDLVGNQPVHIFEMFPGVAIGRVMLPHDFNIGPDDTLNAVLNIGEPGDESVGPGPWIG